VIDGTPVPLALVTTGNNNNTPWYTGASAGTDGVREKLRLIAAAVNAKAGLPWRAEVWGYHLALIAKSGTINQQATVAMTPTDAETAKLKTALVGNVRQYTLGNGGLGSYSTAGTPGTNGTTPLTAADYQGIQVNQTGIYALDGVDLFNLMVIPADEALSEAEHMTLWGAASIYCAQHRAFLVIDAPASWTVKGRPKVVEDTTKVDDIRKLVVKTNSAVFYPRLIVSEAGLNRYVGPGGAIAGLMARIDSSRGVWKAPAGTEADIRAIVGLEVKLTDPENGVLNKIAANCLRSFPVGIVNWGARTMEGSDDIGSEWKYIPIRRLALFLEESLYRGTKWIVFEPNDEPLWAKIRLNINAFMMSLFRQGAFQGSTPDKAFFVKCDGETTTQNDRNLGIVNIEIGFAPLKPAEFVILKIQQIAGQL
ncbi:MAG TPA: phage tail sheath C-terminal domain-containing protein, partial [Pyrinomonadaceae bacterium]|nr:phage tail sheath C-terminal domain-containing protein [Pyrinomonadaceae bacterium]